MEGKVFSDSSNLYQDQARILFNYYKAAAERIVAQEKDLEQKIAEHKNYLDDYQSELQQKLKNKKICWCLCWLIVPIFMAIKYGNEAKELEEQINDTQTNLNKLDTDYKNIFRDYKVNKLGVAYVPVAKRIAFNGKSFVVDHSGSTQSERFTLQIIKDNSLLNSSISDLQILTKEAPVVESSSEPEQVDTGDFSKSIQKVTFHDYFGKLDRTLRTVSYCLTNVDESTVELPVVSPDSKFYAFLEEHAASDTDGRPVFNVFNTTAYDKNIEQFNSINETRKAFSNKSEEIDKTLRQLICDMAQAVQTTSTMKVAAASSLVEYSNRILFNCLKASYNFYSPVLEADEIERIKNETFNYTETEIDYHPFNLRESSRVRFDLTSMSWVAEDGSRTIVPFGINQIQEEILAPIVTNLMRENRKDRLEIYNHIKDQKIDYLNQWHRDTEDFYGRNRAEANNLINIMRGNLAEYTANFNTLTALKNTVEKMNTEGSLESASTEAVENSDEVMLTYQMQSQEFIKSQNDFAEYMERLHEDIDTKAAKFGHVEYFDASLRDRQAHEIAEASENVDSLDNRRKPLAEVSPLLAVKSTLPPEPDMSKEAFSALTTDLNGVANETLGNLDRVVAPKPEQIEESPVEDEETHQEENAENVEKEDTSVPTPPVPPTPPTPPVPPTSAPTEVPKAEETVDNEGQEDVKDWKIGDPATFVEDEGNEKPYDDGEYEIGDGRIVVIKDGIITNIYNCEE